MDPPVGVRPMRPLPIRYMTRSDNDVLCIRLLYLNDLDSNIVDLSLDLEMMYELKCDDDAPDSPGADFCTE